MGDRDYLYRFWKKYLEKTLSPQAKVLEVGCGVGYLGKRLQASFRYTGVDVSEDAVVFAKKHGVNNVQVGEAECLPFPPETFEAVIAFDVVEHLKEPGQFLQEAHRVLRLDGTLLIRTPNVNSLGVRLKTGSKKLLPAMLSDATHVSLFAEEIWFRELSIANFVVSTAGTDFLWDIPYTRYVPTLIQKLILIPMNILFAMFIGFSSWKLGENLIVVARKARNVRL
jgi:SAM-dependent methyltransferase